MKDQTENDSLTTIIVDFDGDERQFTLKEDQQAETLLNYDRMKRRILQTYKYLTAGKDSIRLCVQNFYKEQKPKVSIPIHAPDNYTYLLADMASRGINSIILKVQVIGELMKRRQREKVIQVEFDSEGSVESADNDVIKTALLQNKPKKQPYRGANVVRCLFCHHSNRQVEQKKRSGAFYGPFKDNRYAHLMCLLWCSDVWVSQQRRLCGVQKAINHTKNVKCSICNQKGASFICHNKRCNIAGHYRCAQDKKWNFNWINYTSYCPKCSQEQPIMSNSLTSVPFAQLNQKQAEVKIEDDLQTHQQINES